MFSTSEVLPQLKPHFELKLRLSKLRKERIISDRDEFGKIVLSKVPKKRLFR